MLELRRQASIFGDGGPSVWFDFSFVSAEVYHWLDGKEHTLLKFYTGTGFTEVEHGWGLVEGATESVSGKVAYDGAAFAFDIGLDGMADVAQISAVSHGADGEVKRSLSDVHEALRVRFDPTDRDGPADVAMPSIDDQGHVDIDDIALAQFLISGDSVANHMVHRGAGCARESSIKERSG